MAETNNIAAAKSLQSCLTRCDPIDGSPPDSPVPGILQARTLEWVAISFSNAWKWKVKVKSFSCVRLFTTPWTAAHQAPPSMGFSRQEYWSGMLLPSPIRGTEAVKKNYGRDEENLMKVRVGRISEQETQQCSLQLRSQAIQRLRGVQLPCSSNGKESASNAGDQGLTPGLGSSSGERNGSPLQYSCLENSMDREAWQATVYGVTKG